MLEVKVVKIKVMEHAEALTVLSSTRQHLYHFENFLESES